MQIINGDYVWRNKMFASPNWKILLIDAEFLNGEIIGHIFVTVSLLYHE